MKADDYKRVMKKMLGEADSTREQVGFKAMATSIGKKGETGEVKSYMKGKKFKKAMAGAKERAKGARDPEAYQAAVERKILKGHFGKE
jgi:hypothetical protein